MDAVFSVLLSLHRGTPLYGEWVVACLEGAWPHLIGEKPASVSRPVRFSDSELIVEVFDKDWLDTLKRLEPDLLKKLQASAGTIIKRVRVTGGKPENQ